MRNLGGSGFKRGAGMITVALIALLAAVQIVREAAVADRATNPSLAKGLWPSHPAMLHEQALLDVATAAAKGQPVPGRVRADVQRIASRAPLSPDPFLIEAAIADSEGRAGAEPLLLAARARDPRSRGTRFLLAERYFRSGRIEAGLIEMYALVSLHRGGEPFVPALAAYARTPGAIPALRSFFARKPAVEPAVLSALAGDAANADLVLSLASNLRDPQPDWRPRLVETMVAVGQYEKAYAVWQRVTGIRPQRGLFNPRFEPSAAPPPFNWRFAESREGVAEPDSKGGLSVLYYGRANAVLASQMLLLSPGMHRLVLSIERASGEPGAVRWTIRCASSEKPFAVMPLGSGSTASAFEVPAGCAAQWLELSGVAGDVPQTSELVARDLRLESAGPR